MAMENLGLINFSALLIGLLVIWARELPLLATTERLGFFIRSI